jgi:hypothetical protein
MRPSNERTHVGVTRTGAATDDARVTGDFDAIVTAGPADVEGARGIIAPMY